MLQPTADRVPDVVDCNRMLRFDHHPSMKTRRAARQYHNEPVRQTRRSDGQTAPRIDQEPNSP